MRYILLNAFLLATFCVSGQTLDFTGRLTGLQKNTKVILSDMMGKQFHDTAMVDEDRFEFNTRLPGAGIYVLRVALIGQNPEHRTFYLDAGKVQLTGKRGDLKKAVITSNAPYMKDYIRFMEIWHRQEIFAREKLISDSAIMRAAETGSYEGLFKHMDLVDRMFKVDKEAANRTVELASQWISENPKSDINAYLIYTYLRRNMEEEDLKKALDNLSPAARKSLPGKMMMDKLN